MSVRLKNKHELKLMRKSADILRDVFDELKVKVKAGVTTKELDSFAESRIRRAGGLPAFKGVRGRVPYPATLCVSINDEVVHGIPGPRKIKDGDIVAIDCGAIWRDYYSDAALTIPVGKVSPEATKLIEITREAYMAAVEQCRPGNRLGDVSHAIQSIVEGAGFNVVRDLYGHGIGRDLHEDPPILNYGDPGEGIELKPRMVLAIEVMTCQFGYDTRSLGDGWTVKTSDGGLSAHFEDTILITKEGPDNITRVN